MRNSWMSIAGVFGALGVILGAFGAHGLKERVPADLLVVFEVGVRYHMYHAIAMLAVAVFAAESRNRWFGRACSAWLVGIVIFSGSLYLMTFTGMRWLGAITPIGGVALIVGWCLVIRAGLSRQEGA
ncbi:MAG TPA: DUF423 domain-containing protein [Candidatus Hydrogenedentes bacterium]|nr:DUF423 domain-containing protein [Candidatus Hydrogenedentota bacterium]